MPIQRLTEAFPPFIEVPAGPERRFRRHPVKIVRIEMPDIQDVGQRFTESGRSRPRRTEYVNSLLLFHALLYLFQDI
jgi:hypothetical protein